MKHILIALCLLGLTAVQGISADASQSKARAAIADAAQTLKDGPVDTAAINAYMNACLRHFNSLVKSDRKAAKSLVEEMRVALGAATAKDEKAEKLLPRAVSHLARMESSIESERKRESMIGKAAAPINIDDWVNGTPLSNDDLKGKVVLLDFWAVWCGPCIATFPHLRDWHDEFADDGLVIVGLTRHYNYKWDETKNRASRKAKGDEKNTMAEELEMLAKFAGHHKLKHRFAIQPDREISKYYHVSGIPHVVVIDRKGKIRLMKVGSGSANAKAVEAMIRKLIKEDA